MGILMTMQSEHTYINYIQLIYKLVKQLRLNNEHIY